jgi:hypothetical protein
MMKDVDEDAYHDEIMREFKFKPRQSAVWWETESMHGYRASNPPNNPRAWHEGKPRVTRLAILNDVRGARPRDIELFVECGNLTPIPGQDAFTITRYVNPFAKKVPLHDGWWIDDDINEFGFKPVHRCQWIRILSLCAKRSTNTLSYEALRNDLRVTRKQVEKFVLARYLVEKSPGVYLVRSLEKYKKLAAKKPRILTDEEKAERAEKSAASKARKAAERATESHDSVDEFAVDSSTENVQNGADSAAKDAVSDADSPSTRAGASESQFSQFSQEEESKDSPISECVSPPVAGPAETHGDSQEGLSTFLGPDWDREVLRRIHAALPGDGHSDMWWTDLCLTSRRGGPVAMLAMETAIEKIEAFPSRPTPPASPAKLATVIVIDALRAAGVPIETQRTKKISDLVAASMAAAAPPADIETTRAP